MKRLNRFNSCHIPLKQLQYMTIQFTPQFYLKFKDQINIQNACIFVYIFLSRILEVIYLNLPIESEYPLSMGK